MLEPRRRQHPRSAVMGPRVRGDDVLRRAFAPFSNVKQPGFRDTRLRIPRRKSRPACAEKIRPISKGAGNTGRWMRPQPCVRDEKTHKHSHHGHTGTTRHSPRNGFNGFLRALPGEPGLFATVIPKKLASQELDISVGISGPHDFAVRRIGALVSRAACVHRIPPHVRDDRETPLCRAG
jgi:hypothetical protein